MYEVDDRDPAAAVVEELSIVGMWMGGLVVVLSETW